MEGGQGESVSEMVPREPQANSLGFFLGGVERNVKAFVNSVAEHN